MVLKSGIKTTVTVVPIQFEISFYDMFSKTIMIFKDRKEQLSLLIATHKLNSRSIVDGLDPAILRR